MKLDAWHNRPPSYMKSSFGWVARFVIGENLEIGQNKTSDCGVGCSQETQQDSKSNKLPGSNRRLTMAHDFDLSIH